MMMMEIAFELELEEPGERSKLVAEEVEQFRVFGPGSQSRVCEWGCLSGVIGSCMLLCMYEGRVIKTGTFGQPELFDPKLMQLIFDPGVENRIFVYKYSRKLRAVKRVSSGSCFPSSPF
jgi:hypothetical protein